MMDYLLNEQQIMIRDLCRQIAKEKIAPVAAEYDKTEEFPWGVVKALAQADKVMGLETGADDYITKPFSVRELVARVKSVLRRIEGALAGRKVLLACGIEVDLERHRVRAGETVVDLSPTEFRLLQHLMRQPERVHSRAQLLDKVWGDHVFIEERTVDVHVLRLRKALTNVGAQGLVQTVRGLGYRLSAQHDR